MIRARGSDREDDRILRAKYLDWCSARVAERFLDLTPDEIYERAHRASRGATSEREAPASSSPDQPQAAAGPAVLHSESESFRQIVEAVTRVLTEELNLPSFERWREVYITSPEQFDEELLGLWRESL